MLRERHQRQLFSASLTLHSVALLANVFRRVSSVPLFIFWTRCVALDALGVTTGNACPVIFFFSGLRVVGEGTRREILHAQLALVLLTSVAIPGLVRFTRSYGSRIALRACFSSALRILALLTYGSACSHALCR